jgi:hypothetical protein
MFGHLMIHLTFWYATVVTMSPSISIENMSQGNFVRLAFHQP